jgi:hypothetical protein
MGVSTGPGIDNKLSNIIGTKLPQWVIEQLDTRSNQNTQNSRSNDNLIYLGNKTSWIRLISSVEVGDENDQKYFNQISEDGAGFALGKNFIQNSSSLAKKFVLYGGTSKYLKDNSYGLRSGLGKDNAYGMLGDKEIQDFGYRPMPGITGVHIETQGRLGSLRVATVSFKCWDKYQLDIIDTLYFKLGYSMFLEFGNTSYFKSPYFDPSNVDKVYSSELNSIDPFQEGLTKEQILIKISQNVRDSEGNYGALFGIVTNFNFSYNQDGGYDCTVKITGLGYLGESIKINNPGVLPNILKEEIEILNNTLLSINNIVTTQEPPQSPLDKYISKDSKPGDLLQTIAAEVLRIYKTSDVTREFKPETYAKLASTESGLKLFQTISFLNSDPLSEGAKKELRILLKRVNSINDTTLIYTPSNFGYKISKKNTEVPTGKIEALNFYALDDKAFYELDYKIPGNRYILGKNSTRSNIIISDEFTYSNINLSLSYLKNRYLKNLKDKSSAGNDLLQQSLEAFNKNQNLVKQFPNRDTTTANLLLDNNTVSLGLDAYYRFGVTYTSPALNSVDSYDPYFFNIAIHTSFKDQNDGNHGVMTREQVFSVLNQVMSKDAIEGGVFFNTTKGRGTDLSFRDLRAPGGGDTDNFLSPQIYPNVNPNYQHYYFSVVYYVPVESVGYNVTITNTDVNQATNLSTTTTDTQRRSVYAKVVLSFNDSSLIQNITPDNQDIILRDPDTDKKKLEEQNQKEKEDLEAQKRAQEEMNTQIAEAIKYQSALEILLRTIELHSLNKAINKTGKDLQIGKAVFQCKLFEDSKFITQIFSTGIFSGIIEELTNKDTIKIPEKYPNLSKMDLLKVQAKYGFVSSLMANLAKPEQLKQVDFKELLTTYVVPYQWDKEIMKGVSTNHPVYISFGTLLMLLNHMCTIYDTSKSKDQTPLVYVDFNPNHNFCLSNNQQLSTNPWITLIPCEASFEDYKKLFDPNILSGDKILAVSGSGDSVDLFNPSTQDVLSHDILKFRDGNSFRGRIMNFLLNIDYLVDLVHSYASKNEDNNVYLKQFIEHILSDISKSTGNFNIFRLSYNDAGNTFQVIDDQVVPTTDDEIMVPPNKVGESNRTELPLLGKNSIARSLDIKSDVSTKLGNMIAISANSSIENKATLSKNGDNFGFLNSHYYDRYILDRLEVSPAVVKPNYETAKISAQQFNQSISDFYSKINPSEANVSHVTSYYIDKMTKVKNDIYPTRASAMIPVSVNFTTDGFSGLQIGQAFTIPEMLLPYVYTTKSVEGAPKDYVNKVGFVVVGLEHSFENNEWITSVRANMIYLKESTVFKGEPELHKNTGPFGINERNEISNFNIALEKSPPIEAKERIKIAKLFFEKKGYNQIQVSAIIGGLLQESQLNPNAENPTSHAYGIAQWLGSRKNQLLNKQDYSKLETQLAFVYEELTGSNKIAGDNLKKSTTIEQAIAAMAGYERFAGISGQSPTYQQVLAAAEVGFRIGYTKNIYNTYNQI